MRDLLVLVPGAHTRVHGGDGDGAVREPCHKRQECSAFKPDPEIYLTAMGRLGVSAKDCVVVEDSPIGIRAGKASGALVCALTPRPGVSLDQGEADVVVGSLREVVPLALGPVGDKAVSYV